MNLCRSPKVIKTLLRLLPVCATSLHVHPPVASAPGISRDHRGNPDATWPGSNLQTQSGGHSAPFVQSGCTNGNRRAVLSQPLSMKSPKIATVCIFAFHSPIIHQPAAWVKTGFQDQVCGSVISLLIPGLIPGSQQNSSFDDVRFACRTLRQSPIRIVSAGYSRASLSIR
jgi:hypothetical protein